MALLALAVRVTYVLGTEPRHLPFTDSLYYQQLANDLAAGHGFIDPLRLLATGHATPTAEHPPLYPLVLAFGSLLGARSVQAHQLIGCLIGVGTVLCVGATAATVAGKRAGLYAGVVAAVDPTLWLNDGGIDAESLFALTLGVALLASYRFVRRPSLRWAAALGAALGSAVLTRAESALLLVLLAMLIACSLARRGGRRVGALLSLALLTSLAVIAPWEIRVLATFQRPVFISTEGGGVLAGANCARTYHGNLVGLWVIKDCYPYPLPTGDASVRSNAEARHGVRYAETHLSSVPMVMAIRVAREWEIYRPAQDAKWDTDDGRPTWGNLAALAVFYLMVPFAVGGLVVLRRSGVTLLPMTALVLEAVIAAAATVGLVRFRTPADLVMAVTAGISLNALARRFPASVGHVGAQGLDPTRRRGARG